MRHTSRKTNVNAKQCPLLSNQKHQHRRRLRGVSSTRTRALKQHALAVALTIAFAIFSSLSTAANTALDQTRTYQLNLPEQTVAAALTSLSEQTDIQVLFPYDIATQHQSTALVGNYPLQQALSILLLNTGLHGGLTDSGVITISQTGSNVDINQNGKGKRMNTNKRKTVLATMVGLFAAGGMSATMAQGQVGESARAQNVLDEIIVTAEKRKASLQDVSIAVTALSGDRLENSGIEDSMALEMVTPGLVMSGNGSWGFVTIRGVGSTALQGPGTDPSAAVYIDGVYQSRFTSALIDLVDVAQVEVLRGPQGTLYGRNANAGAIKYTSKEPGNDLAGNVSASFGNYNMRKIKGALDIPLVEDELSIRLSGTTTERDGFTQEITQGYDVDYADLTAGRLTVKYTPSDSLTFVLHGTAINDDGDLMGYKPFVDPAGFYAGAQQISDPREVAYDFPVSENSTKTRALDLTVNWELANKNLTSITAYTDSEVGPWLHDSDGTELAGLNGGRVRTDGTVGDGLRTSNKTFSQELILASAGEGALEWLVGLYYLNDRPSWFTGLDLPQLSLGLLSFDSKADIDAYAAFGNLSYPLTDQLSVNGGVRYSYEKKEFTTSQLWDLSVVRGPEVREESWSEVTPKLGLDYQVSEDVLLYFSWAKGFKSGAFEATSFAVDPADPETMTAYELGAKSTFSEGRVRLNLSAFKYDYKDLQVRTPNVSGTTIFPILANAAEADISGLEAEFSIMPSERMRLDIGLAWLDAEFDQFISIVGITPVDVSGNKLPQSPDFTANVGVEYGFALPENIGDLNFRIDYYYSGEKYFDQFNEDRSRQESYDLLNARLAFTSQDESWSLAAFGKNITDELVMLDVSTAALYGSGSIVRFAPPRTYGLELNYSF